MRDVIRTWLRDGSATSMTMDHAAENIAHWLMGRVRHVKGQPLFLETLRKFIKQRLAHGEVIYTKSQSYRVDTSFNGIYSRH